MRSWLRITVNAMRTRSPDLRTHVDSSGRNIGRESVMNGRRIVALALVLILRGLILMEHPAPAQSPDTTTEARPATKRAVEAADVARLPQPGSVVPGSFAFAPDGQALTFLKSESASLSRVLWRVELPEGTPRVIARPPGG